MTGAGAARFTLGVHEPIAATLDPKCAPALAAWLPLVAEAPGAPAGRFAARVGAAAPPPDGRPLLRLGSVRAFDEGARIVLHSPAGSGAVGLATSTAELVLANGLPADEDLESLLTVALALLLASLGAALVHAAAVCRPGGGAWLVPGDSHAGKSTVCANLITAGWDYLADDQVVVGRGPTGLYAEGWPRPMHLDAGWREGRPRGERAACDPETLGPGTLRREAQLEGVLIPRVEADRPSAAARALPVEVLTHLVRQSPWLMATRALAGPSLELLGAVARLPALGVRLGRDMFRNPELGEFLSAAMER